MSAKSTNWDGNVRVPEACLFCESTDMKGNAGWTKVRQHSHDGEYVTVYTCRDCGGQMLKFEAGNARKSISGPRRKLGVTWRIPEGYCMFICPECGVIIETRDGDDEDDREFIREFINSEEDERPRSACHDVPAELVVGEYRRGPNGEPEIEIPERDV